jgi:MFS family permease
MRRAIPAGLCVTALGSLLFGLLPSFVSSPLALSIGLICFRCLGGLGAAVSETGCLTMISTGEAMEGEDGHLGVALSSVEVCTGVGAAAGTALGGLLFSFGGATPFGAFLFPFVVGAALPLLLVPLCWHALRGRQPPQQLQPASTAAAAAGGGGDTRRSPLYQRRELLRRLPTAVSVVACAAVCETLNPILSPHMLRRFGLDAGQVGLMFSLMCAFYMLGALPIGALADRSDPNPDPNPIPNPNPNPNPNPIPSPNPHPNPNPSPRSNPNLNLIGALTDRWSAGPHGGRRLMMLICSGYLCMVCGLG